MLLDGNIIIYAFQPEYANIKQLLKKDCFPHLLLPNWK